MGEHTKAKFSIAITLNHFYKVCLAAAQGFIKDDCFNKASALTFYSLLSIIPLLAVTFGVAKGFGFEEFLENEVAARFLEQPQIAKRVISFAHRLLENTHGGIIACVGLLSLLWTSIQLFSNIEQSLNAIWGVKRQRTYSRRINDYIAILIFCPIFFVISSSLTVYSIAELSKLFDHTILFKSINTFIFLLIKSFPLLINWILFSFIYIFIPNTKIPWRYALIASLIAGTIYQVVEWAYIYFQFGVATYGTVYGSFAALPLFLVWMNTSWIIVLAGAELTYQMEMFPPTFDEQAHQLLNKKRIGLWIVSYCTEQFLKGNSLVSLAELTKEIGASKAIIKTVVDNLCESGILVQDRQNLFLIAKNPSELKLMDLMELLEESPIERYPARVSSHFTHYEEAFKQLEFSLTESPTNISLAQLVQTEPVAANVQNEES